MVKRVHVTIPDWIEKEIRKSDKQTDRIRELMIKGMMYEQREEIRMLKENQENQKNPENAVSRILSADYEDIPRSFGGFPEAAV